MGLNEKDTGIIEETGLNEAGSIPADSSQIKALTNDIKIKDTENILTQELKTPPQLTEGAYLDQTGNIVSLAIYSISGPIPVEYGKSYTESIIDESQNLNLIGGWYNGDTWIGNISTLTLVSPINFTPPEEATHMRLNIQENVFNEVEVYEDDGYEPIDEKQLIYAYLGDSITDDIGLIPSAYSYHDVIKSRSGITTETLNYGISGTHIANVGGDTTCFAQRYVDMSDSADVIRVFGGVNDFLHDPTVPIGVMTDRVDTTFYGALHVLILGLIEKYPYKKIEFATPLHTEDEDVPNVEGNVLSEFVDAIKEVCGYYGILVIDLYSTVNINPNVSNLKNYYNRDGIHPNVRGHVLIGNAWYKATT